MREKRRIELAKKAAPVRKDEVRAETNAEKVRQLMQRLGHEARGKGNVYFTGGATAVLIGWRTTTIDVDLKFDPEPAGVFEALPRLKDDLAINIELASPEDFMPPLPGWRERSQRISAAGRLEFFHYDFYAQALAKIERSHEQDLLDVKELLARGLVDPSELRRLFAEIEPRLIRYPAIDPEVFRSKLEETLRRDAEP